jgi:hypothetical protein
MHIDFIEHICIWFILTWICDKLLILLLQKMHTLKNQLIIKKNTKTKNIHTANHHKHLPLNKQSEDF